MGSLGLPGLSAFVAEFQIFTGALQAAPVATVIAVTGILVTAGLFLLGLQRLLAGPTRVPKAEEATADTAPAPAEFGATAVLKRPPAATTMPDVSGRELLVVGSLLALSIVLGLLPRPRWHSWWPGERHGRHEHGHRR